MRECNEEVLLGTRTFSPWSRVPGRPVSRVDGRAMEVCEVCPRIELPMVKEGPMAEVAEVAQVAQVAQVAEVAEAVVRSWAKMESMVLLLPDRSMTFRFDQCAAVLEHGE